MSIWFRDRKEWETKCVCIILPSLTSQKHLHHHLLREDLGLRSERAPTFLSFCSLDGVSLFFLPVILQALQAHFSRHKRHALHNFFFDCVFVFLPNQRFHWSGGWSGVEWGYDAHPIHIEKRGRDGGALTPPFNHPSPSLSMPYPLLNSELTSHLVSRYWYEFNFA